MDAMAAPVLHLGSLAIAKDVCLILSVLVIVYSLSILKRGLYNFRDSDFLGVELAGYAGRLPPQFLVEGGHRLSCFVMNSPGVVIPILMHAWTVNLAQYSPNSFLLIGVIQYYLLKIVLSILSPGAPVLLSDALVHYAVNCCLAFSQATSLCYLYDYGKSYFALPIGFFIYLTGFAVYASHEVMLRRLETKFHTRLANAKGGLFRFLSSPHHAGELIITLGILIATWTPASFALFVATTVRLMILANRRHLDMKDKFGPNFSDTNARLIPYVW